MRFLPRSRSEFCQLLLLAATALAAPLLLPPDPPGESLKPIAFDQPRFDKAARNHPNVVLIGNSMLNTRIDKPLLNHLTQPNSLAYVAEGGTRSTVWYFKFKNFAVPLAPKLTFLFYRDYDFTAPWLHLEGERLDTARSFMKPEDEPLLEFSRKLGGVAPHSPLDDYLPDQTALKLRSRLTDLAIDTGAFGRGSTGDTELQVQLNNLFDFQNLRADTFDAGASANDILPTDSKLFTADPAKNLLEKFNALARAHGIRLVFYRVKRRPNAQSEVIQDGELRAYTAAFRTWAESQGHLLLDETEDPRLTLSMYHDGDHLGKAAMAEYTQMFLQRVQSCLPLPPQPAAPTP